MDEAEGFERALRLLEVRARSEAELRRKLGTGKRRCPPEVLEAVIARLKRAGLLDDAAFAKAFVQSQLRRKPQSWRALIAKLGQYGIAQNLAVQSVEAAFEESNASQASLARAAAAEALRRTEGLPARQRVRRALAWMARRGFGGAESWRALGEAGLALDESAADGAADEDG